MRYQRIINQISKQQLEYDKLYMKAIKAIKDGDIFKHAEMLQKAYIVLIKVVRLYHKLI